MTTTDIRTRAGRSGLSFGGILLSEWIKLRTLRSTVWCYLIIVVLTIGLGMLAATAFPSDGSTPDHAAAQSTWLLTATLGISFSQLVTAVLGALVITGEYGTGMIRSTLTAVPKRVPALVAKALVFGVTTFVVGLVSLVATAMLTAPLLPGKGIEPDFGDSTFWLALVGGAGYLALIGVLSLSIGALIRNSAGGIAASLGLVLVLPGIVQILGALTRAEWITNLGVFLPSDAGGRMYAYVTDAATTPQNPQLPDPLVLEPWQGLLVLAAWFVVTFVLGSILLKRRDA
jgi:ABC-2 type transport system permease protein